jgi:monoamine oxidase
MSRLIAAALAVASALDAPHDAVVVGAGFAGLSAAHLLAEAGLDVVVLEGAERVGGRVRNWDPEHSRFDAASDEVVELGGTFVSPSHTALINFSAAMGVAVYNTSAGVATRPRRKPRAPWLREPADGWPWWYWGVDTEHSMASSVMHTRGGMLTFRGPKELTQLLKGVPAFDELEQVGKLMADTVRSLSCESADEHWVAYDGVTFEGWIREHVSHTEGRDVLRAMCRGMIAQEAAAVSFLSTAKSLKGCWSAGDDDQFRLRGGSQAPLLAAASKLGPRLRLSSEVRAVREVEGGGYEVQTAGSDKLRASHVVLTGSPAALLGVRPPLGANDAQLLQRMPMGESAKLFFFYPTAWWRGAGKSANILASDGTPYSACMDHSAYTSSHGSAALMCWIEGSTNLRYFGMENRTAAREEVLAFLEASLGDKRVRTYTSSAVLNWSDDAFARGAYTGYFAPGVQSQPAFWEAYARSEKARGLFVAGSDYYTGLGNGYMDGAVRSGEAAAREIVKRVQGAPP